MRLRIAHSTVYRYDPPAAGVIQVLRLTPRNHEGQYVVDWRIDVSADARLNAHEDAFGNITHVFSADGPFAELRVEVDGEVETQNTDGVVRGTVERFPPSLFLRDTAADRRPTRRSADFALRHSRRRRRRHARRAARACSHRLHEEMICDSDPTQAPTARRPKRSRASAASTRDLTHIFIGAARSLGIPARYVAGYLCADDATARETAATPGPRPTCPISAGSASIRSTASARPTPMSASPSVSMRSAPAPVRGTRYGAGGETLAIAIKVDQ